MIPCLRRTNCVDPGVSILPITDFELRANIHKSGSRRFFDRNIFLNLRTEELSVSLPDAGVVSIPEENRQALEFVQKLHNEFLSVSANRTGGILAFDGYDPVPKAYARFAAQLISDAAEGEWYDTRLGLESLWEVLLQRRSESNHFGKLFKSLSIRRGGRGTREPLSDVDQLMLAEILADLAMARQPEPVVAWEIQLIGGIAESGIGDLKDKLLRLAPDAQIVKVREGSVIIRLRSSERSYTTLLDLNEFGALAKFFGVDKVNLTPISGDQDLDVFGSNDPIGRIVDCITAWRPRSTEGIQELEKDLNIWLGDWLERSPDISNKKLKFEASIGDGPRRTVVDFLLEFRTPENKDFKVIIELVRLRSRSSFFQNLERFARFGMPTILVFVGSKDHLDRLRPDIGRFAELSSQTTIVAVPLDKG